MAMTVEELKKELDEYSDMLEVMVSFKGEIVGIEKLDQEIVTFKGAIQATFPVVVVICEEGDKSNREKSAE